MELALLQVPAPPAAPGAQFGVPPPQSQPSFGMPSNAQPGTRWPPQQAALNSGPTAGGPRPNGNEGPRPGMAPPPPPVSSGCPPNNGVPSQQPSQQPSYQGYPPNVGPGPLQQMGPPWMQPAQHFQRPQFMPFPGNYPGAFQGHMRPLGPPSNGMLGGPPSGVAPGFAMPGQGPQRPVMWLPGPPGASAPRPALMASADPVNMTTTVKSAGSVILSEESNLSGQKADKGPSQVAADIWTAHKTDRGAVYYYNSVTAESTYTRPEGFKGEVTWQGFSCLPNLKFEGDMSYSCLQAGF